MKNKICKAVIPAAGLGTRFLPATKAMPKEMLPVVDKPAIQYVVEEAIRANLDDIIMITGRNKRNLEDHFDRASELEMILHKKGEHEKLFKVEQSTNLANIHYIRQRDPNGLGHAILAAEKHVGNQSFAVLLGDDLIDENESLLSDMMTICEKTKGSVVALMEVSPKDIGEYGCADVVSINDGLLQIKTMIEKPNVGEISSNLAIIGRYVLTSEIFDILKKTPPGKGGEIQLTDALNALAKDKRSNGVYGLIFKGRRYDTGNKLNYLKAVIQLASERSDLGPDLKIWLKKYISNF